MIWSENKKVTPHDIDINDILSASGALRYMQDAAYFQMLHNPPSMLDLRRDGKIFLLSRVSMNVYAPMRVGEELVSESWACESKGVSFQRCCRLLRGEETVAELSSVWALKDAESGRLLKIEDYPQSYDNHDPLTLDAPSRVRVPRDATLKLVGEYAASYNDCDLNMHINNTRYPDILCGFVPDMLGKRVAKLSISYSHEAPLGESVKVYIARGEEDDSYYFRTVREDGQVNVEAYMVLDDIEE